MTVSDRQPGFRGWGWVVSSLAVLGIVVDLAPATAPPSFNREVRPILARCLTCHGPDEAARLARLRLDSREHVVAERRGGRVVDVRNPEASLLLQRVTADDPDSVMPPPGKGRPLDPTEVEILRRWIEAGAPYETHWAWVHPRMSPPPPEAGEEWAIRDLDRYVAAFHEGAGLRPAPRASLSTLGRRASLDLVGLPPSPARIAELERRGLEVGEDAAYEEFVDELLADDAFGERWARVWLDVARYADTKGYEADRRRTMWPWRDWVIRAFNRDVPYDRFTVAQIAGDLLPDGDEEDLLATGFHRNTMTNDEGGTRDEEFRIAAIADRVNTTMTSWMGLTAECAACHDHKYDPISTREYYELFAFFNTTEDADRNDEEPLLRWLEAEDRVRRDRLETERVALRRHRDRAGSAVASLELPCPPDRVPLIPDAMPPGLADGDGLRGRALPWDDDIQPPPGWHRARRVEAEAGTVRQHLVHQLAESVRPVFEDGDRIEVWVRPAVDRPAPTIVLQILTERGGWEHRAYWGDDRYPGGVSGTASRHRAGDLPPPGTWTPVRVDGAALGLRANDVLLGVACTVVGGEEAAMIHFGPVSIVRSGGEPPAWMTDSASWIAAIETVPQGVPEELREAVRAAGDRTPEERDLLERHWAANIRPAGVAATRESRRQLRQRELAAAAIEARAIPVPILREQDLEARRTTRVLARGDWRQPGETVDPGVPEFLHGLAPVSGTRPRTRLDLAEWLVDDDNPLTARVHVNRVWERFFGLGLMETQEDFGTQGPPPRHRGLLDHLARRFVALDWSHKRLCREIATSATYRQASGAPSTAWRKDPRNELLARGPRFRLEAEAIRDAALAVSGRLSPAMYGPPVFPPQPEGVWQVVYSGDRWTPADDEDRYRRGLYTFWRRTSPHPAMTTLDAGSRETCLVRRIRTNTPLQALVLLNEEGFVEAAGGLALLATAEADEGTIGGIVREAFVRALGRPPSEEELEILGSLHRRESERFRSRPEAVRDLLAAARVASVEGVESHVLAATVVVCNVILNLDEFLVRG